MAPSTKRQSALEAVFLQFYGERWLESEGLPEASIQLWADGGGDHVVLKARRKGRWLVLPLDVPALPERAGELVGTIECLVAGLIAEAIELPDDPKWLAMQDREQEYAELATGQGDC